MYFHAVIFDLDGTLLDTLADIAAAANRVLAAHGYPTHSVEAYRWFVGDGSAVLMERAMPAAERTTERIGRCLDAFLKDYNCHWAEATRPYGGVVQLLALLTQRLIPFAVVTNKPEESALLTINHFFKNIPFAFISGLRQGIQKKPDPEQALAAARIMAVTPAQCLFVGDSAVDMHTALKAGMTPVGAGWGFRTDEELSRAGAWRIIHHPLELAAII